ncbi:trehalose-phosphatase [uncultured Desulfobacter sp.]|uniref:trehalose-phosphatase n=1 Tax=uncultured Desulfobacter sp. TaxID=240139 RepID=UPI002AAB0C40|nr:trehalose-phosphatase [uncultured Desulfobacter sp.]
MNQTGYEILKENCDGVIFDLDGVITQTAKVHAKAWKILFDGYLKERAARENENFIPFDMDKDYRTFVDGKPRYDGIESFLTSREIDLSRGDPSDGPGKETIYGLGNQKNEIFNDFLQQQGATVYEDTLSLVYELKKQGWKTAVISASKNCIPVLRSVGILDWFDTVVDGILSEQLGIKGKPEPDIFFEAARRIGVTPARTAVFEDATAGVSAAKKSGFYQVIGVDRAKNEGILKKAGADVVFSDLCDIRINGRLPVRKKQMASLPPALDHIQDILQQAGDRKPVLFLDYDGTLTPIVNDPEKAFLDQGTRQILEKVAEKWVVAVISGRDLRTIQQFVQLDNLYFAGSHGFDIAGPANLTLEMQKGKDFLPVLDIAQGHLEEKLADIPGAAIERKKFSIAIHYRNVKQTAAQSVKQAVRQVQAAHPELRITEGKKVFELQPDIDWHKGKALIWLMEKLNLDQDTYYPLYIGDDITDEDAFETLEKIGTSIIVKGSFHPTSADFVLENTRETAAFLIKLFDEKEK